MLKHTEVLDPKTTTEGNTFMLLSRSHRVFFFFVNAKKFFLFILMNCANIGKNVLMVKTSHMMVNTPHG